MSEEEVQAVKVCVVGLGQIGPPMATYALGQGFETWEYDVSEASVYVSKKRRALDARTCMGTHAQVNYGGLDGC